MTESTLPTTGKLLVCVNASAEARVALTLACLKACRRGGAVELLYVMEPMAEVQTLFSVADRVREERRAEAETLLNSLAEECQRLSGRMPALHLREGRIGEGILDAVLEDADVTMLVLGAAPASSGRGKLVGWLSAQLGDRLLVPLMLVPGNLTEQQIEQLI